MSENAKENYGAGCVIEAWTPEETRFWESTGKGVARRNLMISVPALFLAFAVWMVWSSMTVKLNKIGFTFTTDELFWLTSLPGLTGATLRIFYSFLVPVFGGRRWTALSTLSLGIPALWMGMAVQDLNTPHWHFFAIALLCGFGGGNFASSMANISFFYPKRLAGSALGLNAGLGNLGVSGVQFLVPLVLPLGIFGTIGGAPQLLAGKEVWIQNGAFLWIPAILLIAVAAWFGMNDLTSAKSSIRAQATIFKRTHTWIMSWLYTATFGSFIGYSAGFPMLIATQFPGVDPLKYAFIGPLLGALVRPVGGMISDKLGGARVTFWNFIVMLGAALSVIHFLPVGGQGGSFEGFFASFLLLFVTTGIGNGSTFRMVPVMFRTLHEKLASEGVQSVEEAAKAGGRESAAVIGFTSAIAAYGAFLVPKSYGLAISVSGSPVPAIQAFAIFYVTCIALTWWFYARRNAPFPC
jgi:NNP family nitrate/nitrite transporter-like MFS transporter